jgi:hypothetical protein
MPSPSCTVQEPSRLRGKWAINVYKDKGDRLDFLSYCDIVLVSNMPKLFDRVLFRRLKVVTRVDELQGMCQFGVNPRHQLAMLSKVLNHREVMG